MKQAKDSVFFCIKVFILFRRKFFEIVNILTFCVGFDHFFRKFGLRQLPKAARTGQISLFLFYWGDNKEDRFLKKEEVKMVTFDTKTIINGKIQN